MAVTPVPGGTAPRLPASAQRQAEGAAREIRRGGPRGGRWVTFSMVTLVIIAVVAAAVNGGRDSAHMRDAARTQYRSMTGEGGYDISRDAIWGHCAAAEMTDGHTAVLIRKGGVWVVVRHSTHTDGYNLDSIVDARACNAIAARPQALSEP